MPTIEQELIQGLLQVAAAIWWIVLPVILAIFWWNARLLYIRGKYVADIKWTLFEVKVPKDILKTPKAMEQVFAGMYGIYSFGFIPWEKYVKGMVELWASFEIVGNGGNIRFFVRTPTDHKNLTETAIYSQYPEAEIKEVEDYTESYPSILPNETYEIWGADLKLSRDDPYPIRTYISFEEQVEERRIDPLSAITEAMSKLKDDETIWIQMMIKPVGDYTGNGIKKAGEEIIDKLAGRKKEKKSGGPMSGLVHLVRNMIMAPAKLPEWPGAEKKPESAPQTLMHLTDGEKEVIKGVEMKISKICFATDIRFVYIDKKDAFTALNVSAVMGTFHQFNTLNMNGFRPESKTITLASDNISNIFKYYKNKKVYFRKRKLYDLYRMRMIDIKNFKPPILNIEELATIYHYPATISKSPSVRRIESRRGEAPEALPIE